MSVIQKQQQFTSRVGLWDEFLFYFKNQNLLLCTWKSGFSIVPVSREEQMNFYTIYIRDRWVKESKILLIEEDCFNICDVQ